MMEIRRALDSDFDGIWEIFHEVVRAGDTYVYDPDTTREQAYAIWMSKELSTYVAVLDGQIVGTYILKPNHVGLGSHVANAGYMVKRNTSGKGIGAARYGTPEPPCASAWSCWSVPLKRSRSTAPVTPATEPVWECCQKSQEVQPVGSTGCAA